MLKQSNKSKLIKHNYTEEMNFSELNYRETVQPHENEYEDPSKWISRIEEIRYLFSEIHTKIKIKGKILELGVGSCWFEIRVVSFTRN